MKNKYRIKSVKYYHYTLNVCAVFAMHLAPSCGIILTLQLMHSMFEKEKAAGATQPRDPNQ